MKGHHLHRLPTPLRNAIYTIVGLIFIAVLVPVMFRMGTVTGIFFLFSVVLAFYNGVVWKDSGAVIIIALGYWITNLAAQLLLPAAYEDWKNQSFFNAVLVIGVFIFIWWRARYLKAGKRKI